MRFYISNLNTESQAILKYKKHAVGLPENSNLPPKIYNAYFPNQNPIFHYITIDDLGIKMLPVLIKAIEKVFADVKNKERFKEAKHRTLYMNKYQEGFYKAIESSFIPFIDTPDTRKDVILREVTKLDLGFPLIWYPDDNICYFTPEGFYKYGFEVGKTFNAWSFLLEHPSFFEEHISTYMDLPISSNQAFKDNSVIFVDESMIGKRLLRVRLGHGYTSKILLKNKQELKSNLDLIDNANSNKLIKPTQAIYALYYYYLQETGCEPHFEKHPGGKTQAIAEIAQRLNISSKNFQTSYNKISQYPSIRIATNQIDNIKAVILLLSEYPKAQELAKDELKTAEAKR